MRARRTVLALWLASTTVTASGYEIEHVVAGYNARRYRVSLEAVLDAPAPAVMTVLTRYEDYPALDSRIRAAQLAPGPNGERRLVTTLAGCVGSWLCRDLKRVESLQETPLVLEATIIPAESDLRYGRAVTRLRPDGDKTHVSYTAEFELGFWAPGWLIRRAMMRTLESGTRDMFAAVERNARTTGEGSAQATAGP